MTPAGGGGAIPSSYALQRAAPFCPSGLPGSASNKPSLSLSLPLLGTHFLTESLSFSLSRFRRVEKTEQIPWDESLSIEKLCSVFMEAKSCILYSLQSYSIGSLQKGAGDKRWDRSSPSKGRSDGRLSVASAFGQMPR
ncbi:unnamed protein product [Victoria cruziana]